MPPLSNFDKEGPIRRKATAAGAGSRVKARSHDRQLYSGLIHLHILHHACEGPIFGLGMIEELARHGYRLSPGTMYPLLRGLEARGLLRSERQLHRGRLRCLYQATPAGHRALKTAKQRVTELFGELFEHEAIPAMSDPSSSARARGEAGPGRSTVPDR